jgi:hypothetical protein
MPKISIFSMSLEDPILQRNNCKDRLTWLTATFYTQLILRSICNMHRYRIKPNKCVILISVSRITSEREISDKIRVSVQGVKSLGGHFACLCQGFEFYEVKKKKKMLLFFKKKMEILLHFLSFL